ncbi:acetyl-CoA hydrolase/transferase C-terminal domain-containing protein [Actinophytocola sp.]|uniref:acetyl-CoA hydrolase/transferase C-terminal domain-containing protein n=1 Tax=Actinophytocola sp. TaxID=1872138 RepID=UPI0025BC4A23|nr:acetyl-CoA hydrolase/transferase C-terminal domain-containing protein [Actinophytocola sp.]
MVHQLRARLPSNPGRRAGHGAVHPTPLRGFLETGVVSAVEVINSGFGGQTDFVVGALHSPGGKAIIALPSWHTKVDVSTVVPRLTGGPRGGPR